MQRYRTPEGVIKRIDAMLKNGGQVVLDHGMCAYEYDHYEYEPASHQNGYQSKVDIFYKDFDKDKTVRHYMTLTEDNLRKPKKDEIFREFVSCYWEKEFPTLLVMREYEIF